MKSASSKNNTRQRSDNNRSCRQIFSFKRFRSLSRVENIASLEIVQLRKEEEEEEEEKEEKIYMYIFERIPAKNFYSRVNHSVAACMQ